MKNTDFNLLAKQAFESAKKRGFHDEEHTVAHWIMLVGCELAEAVEADREGRRADVKTYNFLLQEYGEELENHLFEMYIKDTLENELADAAIRLLDYIGMMGFEIVPGYMTSEACRGALEDTFMSKEWSDLKTFAERVFVSCMGNLSMAMQIPESTLFSVFSIAEFYEIDLIWFVHEKMRYNEHRERLHGKAY